MRCIATTGFLLLAAQLTVDAQTLTRVIVTDSRLKQLLENGRSRSTTFRAVVDQLEHSEWMILIQPEACPEAGVVGCVLPTVGRFEGRRSLSIRVSLSAQHSDRVSATLAHELQHAVEIVSDGSVVDSKSLIQFVERTANSNFRGSHVTVYETALALRTGRAVLRELRNAHRGVSPSSSAPPLDPRVRNGHVRSSDPDIRRAIDDGARGSATFGRLVDRLDASDVIVYIETDIQPHPCGFRKF
jgi:hypothetical protein